MRYDVLDARTGLVIEADVLGTPALISEGTRGTVEAYRDGQTGRGQTIWKIADRYYLAPEGVVTHSVKIRVTEGDSGAY